MEITAVTLLIMRNIKVREVYISVTVSYEIMKYLCAKKGSEFVDE